MNEQQRNQYKEKEEALSKTQSCSHEHRKLICGNCGATYDDGDLFCPECGNRLGGRKCPNCHAEITATCEICPKCGKPTDLGHCSFCGAEFEGDEPFCGECGSPRAGIVCPDCGTKSFRSFCPNCNRPLNDNAMMATEQAKNDPKYQRVLSINKEMAEMEEYLISFKNEIEKAIAEAEAEMDAPDVPGLSAEGEALQAKYAELMKLLGNQPNNMPQPNTKAARPKESVKRKRDLKLKFADADKIMEAYKAKAAEMQSALKEMLPDADMTPAQQRDYACARKVPVIIREKEEKKTWWVCNYCGCYHRQPSECAEPWQGGTWLTEEIVVEKKIWQYMD